MSDEDEPKRRGRPRRSEPARPTGYRAIEPVRRHLELLKGFLGIHSDQSVIDFAVREYMAHLREINPRYAKAAEALDEEIGRAHGNVAPLPGRGSRARRSDAGESS